MSDNADTGATDNANDAAQAVADMAGESSSTNTEVAQRPEHYPEKFWDAEKGELRTDDVLKSYGELEKRFGSFTGAPDEYAIGLSDELKEQGIELKADSPMVEEMMKLSKELGLNQEGFSKVVNMLGMSELARHNAEREAIAADIASLGDNSDRRINNLTQWAANNLPGDLMEGFKDMAVSADSVRAMEQLVSMTRAAPVNADGAQPVNSVSREEVQKMQFEKDEFGNRRIAVDPAFRAEYEKKRDLLYGTEEHRTMVG